MSNPERGDVSRETAALPPVPAEAGRLVPAERVEVLHAYAQRLAGDGIVRGLIGPREISRLWDRHVLNCAVLARELPSGTVADVGSGAGLPGLVVAIARPEQPVTLVEPLLRRTTFLEEVAADLGLTNVEVVRARAEELHGERTFDVVTSRAVAPLDRLTRWCLPLVAAGGAMIAMKGSSAQAEVEEHAKTLHRLGATPPRVRQVGEDVVDEPTTLVDLRWREGFPHQRRRQRPRR